MVAIQYEKYKPLKATYLIYSGEPDERAAPTKTDRRIAIVVEGGPAKDIFDSLYPDAKGDIWRSYRPSDGYRCFLGYKLRNGQPDSGAGC